MRSLRDLRQLIGVAEEDQVARRGRHRHRIGERELPALVDEERVHVLVHVAAREEPRVPARSWSSGSSIASFEPVQSTRRLSYGPRPALLQPPKLEAASLRCLLEVVQELVDRLVAERGHADPLPRAHERDRDARAVPRLPEPGGPCTKR